MEQLIPLIMPGEKGFMLSILQDQFEQGGNPMNIRKNIDYSEMYAELDKAMAADIPQMELYCKIGKAVCRRTEKGAAVAAAAYLSRQYPDVQGFSPRNLRRMRDFYRTYQGNPQCCPWRWSSAGHRML